MFRVLSIAKSLPLELSFNFGGLILKTMSDETSAQQCETPNAKLETVFAGFALTDCVIQADPQTEKYLRRVIRAALELSVYNRFGAEIGGFWLMSEQIEQLRKLSEYYSPLEAVHVARAVELYLKAQLHELYEPPRAQDYAVGNICYDC